MLRDHTTQDRQLQKGIVCAGIGDQLLNPFQRVERRSQEQRQGASESDLVTRIKLKCERADHCSNLLCCPTRYPIGTWRSRVYSASLSRNDSRHFLMKARQLTRRPSR